MNERVRVVWPLGVLPILLPAAAIAGVVLLSTTAMLDWPYQEWVRTSAEFHQQNAFAAPIAAAAATYLAGRLTPPHRVFAQPFATRTGTPVVASHLAVLVAAFVAAYTVGFAPLVVRSVVAAEYGGPSVLVVLTGYLGLVAATVVGYAIGVVGRTALLAPVSFLLMFGVTVLGTGGDTFSALAPVLHVSPILGSVETLPFVTYRLVFFAVVAISAATVASAVLRRHRDGWRLPPLRTTVPLLMVVALALPPLVRTPALFAFEKSPPHVCTIRDQIEFTVHSGHQSQMDALVAAVEPLVERHGPAPGTKVYDEALRGAYMSFDQRSTAQGMGVLWYPIQPRIDITDSTVMVSNALSGLNVCFRDGKHGESADLAADLAAWLRASGEPEGNNRFAGRPVATMREWIASNRPAVASCSLTAAALP